MEATDIYRIGIDIGSTTLKVCLLNNSNDCLLTDYQRHNANPRAAAADVFERISTKLGKCRLQVMMTGSVGMGYAERMGVDFEQEVIAASEVVSRLYPGVHTLIDMGGEDSKMIFFDEGRVPDMRMNGNCAGGTGSFIDQTATLLGVETAELDALAAKADTIYPIASRCGVFSKTDIQNLLARGVSKNDIAASMFRAVAMQVVSALARGVEVKPRMFLCGGPFAFLPQLRTHLTKVLGLNDEDCVLPENPQCVPALGCALKAEGRAYTIEELKTLFCDSAQCEYFAGGTPAYQSPIDSGLAPLFASTEEYEQWKERKRGYEMPRLGNGEEAKLAGGTPAYQTIAAGNYYLGVDSGSTTTKVVLIDSESRVVYSDYSFNEGDSYRTFANAIERLRGHAANPTEVNIAGSAATGYGESLLRTAFSLDYGIVETMAHFMTARSIDPNVTFVLDIGGQDMKAIFVDNGSIRRIEINEACSSGCGSFIMTFANQLGYSISDFARLACFGSKPYDLGTRCTVFMNSKVKQAMREGAAIDDIAAGFSYSVIKNCLFKVMKLHSTDELGDNIVVQGGTFKNHSVVRALEKMTGHEVRFSDAPEMAGAYGAALYAKLRIEN